MIVSNIIHCFLPFVALVEKKQLIPYSIKNSIDNEQPFKHSVKVISTKIRIRGTIYIHAYHFLTWCGNLLKFEFTHKSPFRYFLTLIHSTSHKIKNKVLIYKNSTMIKNSV